LKPSPRSFYDRIFLQAYSPDGRWGYGMASLYEPYTIPYFNATPFPCIYKCFQRTSHTVALYQVDLATSQIVVRRQWTDAVYTMDTRSMTTSPDGRLLAIGTENDDIHVIDLTTNRDLGRLAVPEEWSHGIGSVVFSPDGKQIAGCSTWGACIWDVPPSTDE